MRVGQRGRCQVCGGKIVIIKNPRVISLNSGMWVHVSAVRRTFALHAAVGPKS